MQAVSLSLFRFPRTRDKFWAFGQMQFARGPLGRWPQCRNCWSLPVDTLGRTACSWP